MSQKYYGVDVLLALFGAYAIAPQTEPYRWRVNFLDFGDADDDLFAYLIDDKGAWLSFQDGLSESELRMTGYSSWELKKREVTSSGVCIWGLQNGAPLLPIPFTLAQLLEFEERAGRTLTARHQCGDEIELHIQELMKRNPNAAEIVRALVLNKMPETELSAEPVSTAGVSDDLKPAHDGPLPLTTGNIAFSFDGLHWTEQQWKKPLGDKPKWLQACIAIPGARGTSETHWYPVLIGAALVQQGHATVRNVRAKFQTVHLLKPWLDIWKTYESDNLDSN